MRCVWGSWMGKSGPLYILFLFEGRSAIAVIAQLLLSVQGILLNAGSQTPDLGVMKGGIGRTRGFILESHGPATATATSSTFQDTSVLLVHKRPPHMQPLFLFSDVLFKVLELRRD